jgi:hypothetical protein
MRFLLPALLMMWISGCQSSSQAPATGTPATEAAAMPVDPAQWSAVDRQLTPLVNAYFAVKDALVEWDSTAANRAVLSLRALSDSLVADSTVPAAMRTHISSVGAEAAGFLEDTDLTEKRRAFHMMSQHLLPLLKEAGYAAQPVYQQVCPMAFNDTETAFWLSNKREIVNPYLGTKHPKYASGMLHCGELSDSLTVRP